MIGRAALYHQNDVKGKVEDHSMRLRSDANEQLRDMREDCARWKALYDANYAALVQGHRVALAGHREAIAAEVGLAREGQSRSEGEASVLFESVAHLRLDVAAHRLESAKLRAEHSEVLSILLGAMERAAASASRSIVSPSNAKAVTEFYNLQKHPSISLRPSELARGAASTPHYWHMRGWRPIPPGSAAAHTADPDEALRLFAVLESDREAKGHPPYEDNGRGMGDCARAGFAHRRATPPPLSYSPLPSLGGTDPSATSARAARSCQSSSTRGWGATTPAATYGL